MTADAEVRIKQHMQITAQVHRTFMCCQINSHERSCADLQLDAEPDQTHAGISKNQREYHCKHIAMFQFL